MHDRQWLKHHLHTHKKKTVAPAMDTADAMQLEQTHDGSHTLVSDIAHTEDRGMIVDAITLGHTTQKS